MDMRKIKRILLAFLAAYWLFAGLIYAVGQQQFRATAVASEALSPAFLTAEITDGVTVRQQVTAPADWMDTIDIMVSTHGRTNTGTLHLDLQTLEGQTVGSAALDVSALADGQYARAAFDQPVEGRRGESLALIVSSEGCSSGNAVSLYAGESVSVGRFDIAKTITDAERYRLSGEMGPGMLCVKLNGLRYLTAYRVYWIVVAVAFVLTAALLVHWVRAAEKGRGNPLTLVCNILTRYGFLMRQLISRDFKTRYKRSVLGMAWSFLNPLMTMTVQYIVFSTLFKSNIDNYVVYLMVGIVFMNFFIEAVNQCMISITSNATLIKKVYMPRYIFPLTKVVSSLINFGLALLPLLAVVLLSGTRLRLSLLLLPFDILCLLGFVLGMGLLLTTAMTFFQDTQFLWGVVSMMWMYLTPVFYPESIIPQRMLALYHMNPMYQYINFARICIIQGVSPAAQSYLWCALSATAVLGLGVWVFRRHQDQFVMYL